MPFFCINNAQKYQNNPFDPDLDSVEVTIVGPLGSGTCHNISSLPWGSGYNINYPFSALNFNMNSSSGALNFTPILQGQHTIAFRATDYDKITGQKIGSSNRDMNFTILPCSTPSPLANDSIFNVSGATVSYINGVPEVSICPGANVCFITKATTTNSATNFKSSCKIGGASPGNAPYYNASFSFTSTLGAQNEIIGNFCWTPNSNDYGTHSLVITYTDSTCTAGLQNILLSATQNVIIKVLPGVSGGGPYNYCDGGLPLQLNATGPQGITTWWWSVIPGQVGLQQPNFSNTNIANPTASPNQTMDVIVEGLPVVSGCPNKDTVTLNVFAPLVTNVGPNLSVCANDTLTINALTNRPGVATWTPSNYLSNTNNLTTKCVPLTSQQYVLSFTDQYGCKRKDTLLVNLKGIRPILNSFAKDDTICKGQEVKLFSNAATQPSGRAVYTCNGVNSNVSIGNGNLSSLNTSPFYRDFFVGYRAQYLITKQELLDAGFSQGIITGLSFYVNLAPSNPLDILNNFSIKLGSTNNTSLNKFNGFIANLTPVYNSFQYDPILGNNSFIFPNTMQYYWDANSNIVVDISYDLPSFSGSVSAEVDGIVTKFNASLFDRDFINIGNQLTGNSFNAYSSFFRPNIKFDFCSQNNINYTWAPANSFLIPNIQNQTIGPKFDAVNTTYTVTAVSDSVSCATTKTVTIVVDNSCFIKASSSPEHICGPGIVNLNVLQIIGTIPLAFECGEQNYTTFGNTNSYTFGTALDSISFTYLNGKGTKRQFLIKASELKGLGIPAGEIKGLSFNVVLKNSAFPYKNFKINLSCTDSNELNTFQNIGFGKNVYSTAFYNSNLGWNNFIFQTPFLWNGISNIIVDVCFTYDSLLNNDVLSSSATSFKSVFENANYLDPCDIGISIPISNNLVDEYNRPDFKLSMTQVYSKPIPTSWTPANFIVDSTKAQTDAYLMNSQIYTVSIIDEKGNKIYDTISVNIIDHDLKIEPNNIGICTGDTILLVAKSKMNKMNNNINWWPNIDIISTSDSTALIKANSNTNFHAAIKDVYGCVDTAFANIIIKQVNPIHILNGDTLLLTYAKEIILSANKATTYNWINEGGNSIATSNNFYTAALKNEKYYLFATDSNNCKSVDSIYFIVSTDNPVFIPTIFSPNGDGKNELFRVHLFNTYKVLDFNVFSRMGQLVFSASNNNGWDGKINGIDCDMDTYTYLIKVQNPDNSTKVYKGDVLLSR